MQSYDDSKPCKYITYLDANNLYGWEMSQQLPSSEFKWLNKKEIDKFDINLISENSLDMYILDVDLECSDEQHKLHNDHPLAPEKLKISHDMLSKYCSNISNKYNIKLVVLINQFQIQAIKVNMIFITKIFSFICH